MSLRRPTTMLAAALAASLLMATPAAALSSKLDARLRAARGRGVGPGLPRPGPRRPVFLRVSAGTSLEALRAAFPTASFGSRTGGPVPGLGGPVPGLGGPVPGLGDVITASADDAALDALALDARVLGVDFALRAHPVLDVVRSSVSVSGQALGTIYGAAATDLANATGAGVVVGVVDTGIDWTHKDFINDPNISRVLSIWDQTISSHAGGPFPSGFSYGAEYTNASITSKLQGGAVTINTKDTDGHGTHVASIAAGDGTDTNGAIPAGAFKGMAPNADIIAVRTSFNTADIVDGVNYIIARAAAAGKRAVINLSLGLQAGPHDGTSSFEASLGAIARSTPIVVAMGNDGAANSHASAALGVGGGAAVVVNVNGTTAQADIEFWIPNGDAYTVTVTLSGIGGSLTATAGSVQSTTLGGHTVQIDNATNTGHPLFHKQILVTVSRGPAITAPSITAALTRTGNGGGGRVDGYVDPAAQQISFATFVDAAGTLGEPACASDVFAVASYVSKKFWNAIDGFTYNFTTQAPLAGLSLFSSRGPTRDGRQAPEVTAPGDVIAAALSLDPAAYPGDPFVLPDARHRILRGTSMAAPIVTGILAARMQWGPGRAVSDLREILRAQARADSATGSVPNFSWGYGKTASSPQPVSVPTGLTAMTLGTSSVTWNWSTVVGADSYTLYYATNPAVVAAAGVQPPYTQIGLPANTLTGVLIKGTGAGVPGPGSFITTATYAAPLGAPPTAAGHVSSATLSFAPCPASPPSASCSGYAVTASTAANLTGTLFSAVTNNRADSALAVTGLQPLTLYYLRLATLNPLGAQTALVPVSTTTRTDLVAPTNPQFSAVTSASMRLDWNPASNPPGVTYNAEASSSPVFAGTVLSSATAGFFAAFSGMTTNTSYYFRVAAAGGPSMSAGPVATLAASPVPATAPYSALSQTGFTVSWSSAGNPGDTLYQAEISSLSDFSAGVSSSRTRNAFAAFSGLTPNTLYYARALAISHGGSPSVYALFGSTRTFVQNPTLPGQPFSGQGSAGFTFTWIGGNPSGTSYRVNISTSPNLVPPAASVDTTALSASFSGLNSNRLYYAAVAALNLSGTPTAFTAAVSTATTVVAPTAPGAPTTARSNTFLSTSWSPGTLALGTDYEAQASTLSDFSTIAATSVTANAFATLPNLAANTVHYLRVRALSRNPPTPDGPWTAIGPASTLANPPGATGVPFPMVGASSVTVAWTALPLAPPASACAGYRAELSADLAFTTISHSSVTAAGGNQATFLRLSFGTTYYARVASLNLEGVPNYFAIGSTITAIPALSSGIVEGGALTLTLPPSFAVAPLVQARVEPGTFPPGTAVVMLAGVSQDLSAPPSRAAKLTALGTAVGVEITASGLQPMRPVRLTFVFDPLLLPAGSDARRLRMARFDEASGLWALVPSAADARTNTLVATLDHFSSYAPFFVAAGASVGEGIVFPQPWELGDPAGSYGAPTLTFSNYPAGTKVRVLTLAGELIWEGTAGADGVLAWDGRSRFGRPAASGVYYAVIEGGGGKTMRRVVLIR